jgi:capsular exopolysaccharide synthesis family protein
MNPNYLPVYSDPYDPRFENDNFEFKHYISLFISNWYWFAATLFISITIAYGINRWSEKVYTVSSTLLIKTDQYSGLSNIFTGNDASRSQQNLTNEFGILKSFNLNYKVMQELPEFYIDYIGVGRRGVVETRMYNTCPFLVEFNSLEKQSIGQRVDIKILSDNDFQLEIDGNKNYRNKLVFGQRFNEMGFDFIINLRDKDIFQYDPKASNKYYFYFLNPVSLANAYRSKLSVTPIQTGASLVILSTSGSVPAQEIDYLNKLMDIYLDFGLELKNKTSAQTIVFIENQLKVISDSLRIAEGNLENFKLVNNFINISSEGSLVQSKFEKIDEDKTTLLLQKQYYEYLKDYIESKVESEDIVAPSAMGVTDPLLTSLVSKISEFQLQRKKIAMNLRVTEEPLKLLESNILTARLAISENIKEGLHNIDRLISDQDAKLLKVEQEIKKLPSTERQMINIQRKYELNNTVYTFLLEKQAEAGIAKAANVPDNRIIDNAGSFNISRIKPKESKNLTIALVLGLLFPLLVIVLIDYLNNKIIDKRDIERGTSAPIIGFISHSNSKTEMPVIENPGSSIAESFRSVRTYLKYFVKDTKCPVISVSSTIIGEGKTFISANLAAIIALSGKKVLLIGLDLRKPRIHKVFGISNDSGISNFLIGEGKYENVIIKTEIENLWYTPAGPVPPNPAELIETATMRDFIEKAKKRFEYIIIDTPPVAIVTDAILVSQFTDLYIFVVRQRYSSKNTLELIEELYKNENIKSLGIVMNDISISGYYGYGLRYGYSLGYGYTYGYNYYGNYAGQQYGYSDPSKSYYKDE